MLYMVNKYQLVNTQTVYPCTSVDFFCEQILKPVSPQIIITGKKYPPINACSVL